MTEVAGSAKQVGQGMTQKTFNYEPLNALVDIVTNTAGQVVSAVVQKKNGGGGGGGSGGGSSSTASASGTPMPVSLPVASATSSA